MVYPPSAPRSLQQEEYAIGAGPNRSNASTAQMAAMTNVSSFTQNHNHRPTASPSTLAPTHPSPTIYHTPPTNEVDFVPRHAPPQQHHLQSQQLAPLLPVSTSTTSRCTLWWCDLEPWMDEEYARQVCSIMGWDPVNIKVPHPPADPAAGQPSANNPGYCFLTFPSHAHAAAVLAQVNASGKGNVTMPNSSRPFVLNWASSLPAAAGSSGFNSPATPSNNPPYQKEYSIFVGDLAPETSNSDLVSVFRNPVLGLRNDREPKFIKPFLSCKSAKIMLDPVTGVSRGYGFVRYVLFLTHR